MIMSSAIKDDTPLLSLHNGITCASLTSVEKLDDLGEDLEEVHIVVAVVLHFVDEQELRATGACDGSQ